MYGINKVGRNCIILENVTLGYPGGRAFGDLIASGLRPEDYARAGVSLGDDAVIRPGTTIYCEVAIGNSLRTGHNALVRESTRIGDAVLVGTNVVIDGHCTIGSHVSIQSNAYVPTNTLIEDHVFLGPCCALANDKYPVRVPYELKGPTLREGASVGANATLLPGVEIGEGAMVAAGAVVTKDVPPRKLAIGCPARIAELPEKLRTVNRI